MNFPNRAMSLGGKQRTHGHTDSQEVSLGPDIAPTKFSDCSFPPRADFLPGGRVAHPSLMVGDDAADLLGLVLGWGVWP